MGFAKLPRAYAQAGSLGLTPPIAFQALQCYNLGSSSGRILAEPIDELGINSAQHLSRQRRMSEATLGAGPVR
jgi:hypothetical protein